MKEIRFQRVRGAVLIDITCACGSTIRSSNPTTKRSFRHKVQLRKDDKKYLNRDNSVNVCCNRCSKEYFITPHTNHIHVESVNRPAVR